MWFKKCKKAFIFLCLFVVATSCTEKISYVNSYGSNNEVIYKDSSFAVQRSTEVLGSDLLISHIVSKLDSSNKYGFSILKLADGVEGMSVSDTLSIYSNLKEYSFKRLLDVPDEIRSLTNKDGFQVIYFFRDKHKFPRKVVLTTELEFVRNGEARIIKTTDTLIRQTTKQVPQP